MQLFVSMFFKINFFKTKIFICFNSPGLFVHLLCLSLVQEDFRTDFIFIVALTKKKYLPVKLFPTKSVEIGDLGCAKPLWPGQGRTGVHVLRAASQDVGGLTRPNARETPAAPPGPDPLGTTRQHCTTLPPAHHCSQSTFKVVLCHQTCS